MCGVAVLGGEWEAGSCLQVRDRLFCECQHDHSPIRGEEYGAGSHFARCLGGS